LPTRRIDARLEEVAPVGAPAGRAAPALRLVFRALRAAQAEAPIEDRVALGPALDLETAVGVGKLLRILRAARLAAPSDASVLLGDPTAAAELLTRAIGTRLVLEVRTRSDVRFTVWTEEGVESVDRVADVTEDAEGFLVRRRGTRRPVRVPREGVVRRRTTSERWLEVVSIERPEA
jgi:hypothetical protein